MYRTHYNKESKLWSGNDFSPLYNPKVSLGEITLRALIKNGSKIAQISDDCGVQMTFDEIRIKAIRAANRLQKLGYQPGSVFALMTRNSKDVASIVFASLFVGCPVNTLDPHFNKIELLNMLKTTKPCLMFCDIDVYDLVEECRNELGLDTSIFTVGGQKGCAKNVESLFVESDDDDQFSPVKVDAENHLAFIVCSSGTTSLSKGICLTHAALAACVADSPPVDSNDTILCIGMLYWITSIMNLFIGTLCGAKRIITQNNCSDELYLRSIEKYKVTYSWNPPYHIASAMRNEKIHTIDLSSLKCQIITGTRVPIDMPDEWNKRLSGDKHCHVIYGLSESNGPVTVDYPQSGKKGTVGRLINGVRVKIVDDLGNRCGPNVEGEVCVKPMYKFSGYYGNEKATLEMYDAEGFLLCGDIGYFDDDGDLFIVDRKKDMLKYLDFDITPSVIENVLITHPDIDSVCVVGVNEYTGSDLPAAVVIPKKGSKITEVDVFNMVADRFPDAYKLRGGVYFVDSFPISTSGKVLKREVKKMAVECFEGKKK